MKRQKEDEKNEKKKRKHNAKQKQETKSSFTHQYLSEMKLTTGKKMSSSNQRSYHIFISLCPKLTGQRCCRPPTNTLTGSISVIYIFVRNSLESPTQQNPTTYPSIHLLSETHRRRCCRPRSWSVRRCRCWRWCSCWRCCCWGGHRCPKRKAHRSPGRCRGRLEKPKRNETKFDKTERRKKKQKTKRNKTERNGTKQKTKRNKRRQNGTTG